MYKNKLINVINKYKKTNKISIKNNIIFLDAVDLSIIENTENIKLNSVSKQLSIIDQHHRFHKNDKESYYSNGIIENMYNIKCNYNWVLGYLLIKQYGFLFDQDVSFILTGVKDYHIINGMLHYISNNKNENCIIKKINYKCIDLSQNTEIIKDNVLNGIVDNNFININNINYWKSKMSYNYINCIVNIINPINTNINILLSLCVYVNSLFFSNKGVLITRIFDTYEMAQMYIDYILIFCLLFKNINLFKIPVSKNNIITYRYYIICNKKNKFGLSDWFSKKILSIIDLNEELYIDQSIISDEIILIKAKILTFYKQNTDLSAELHTDLSAELSNLIITLDI